MREMFGGPDFEKRKKTIQDSRMRDGDDPMQMITIMANRKQIRLLEEMRDKGLVSSRSEAMRACLTLGLEKLLKALNFIGEKNDIIENAEEFVRVPSEGGLKTYRIVRRLE